MNNGNNMAEMCSKEGNFYYKRSHRFLTPLKKKHEKKVSFCHFRLLSLVYNKSNWQKQWQKMFWWQNFMSVCLKIQQNNTSGACKRTFLWKTFPFLSVRSLIGEIKKMTEDSFWDKFHEKHNQRYYNAQKKYKTKIKLESKRANTHTFYKVPGELDRHRKWFWMGWWQRIYSHETISAGKWGLVI